MKKNYCQQLVFQNACRERKKKQTTLNNNDVVLFIVRVRNRGNSRITTGNNDKSRSNQIPQTFSRVKTVRNDRATK